MIQKIRGYVGIIGIVLSIMGLVTFSLFIFEESLQTVMFGTWAAQDAKRWDLVLDGCDLNRKINTTMKIVNYGCGWIQPFAFLSYRAYAKSTDQYIESLEAKVFAHQPELMVGRTVTLYFTPKQVKYRTDHVELVTGRLAVIMPEAPDKFPVTVSGKVIEKDGRIVVDGTF